MLSEPAYYVSVGEGPQRSWTACTRYGFVSAGQGEWYSKPFRNLLRAGVRIYAYQPRRGYVGLGRVTEPAQPVRTFTVVLNGQQVPILEAPFVPEGLGENADNPQKSEYVVRVKWSKVLSLEKAYWETGMFSSRHTACRLTHPFTLDRLIKRFGLTP